jgi:hypothetical protein
MDGWMIDGWDGWMGGCRADASFISPVTLSVPMTFVGWMYGYMDGWNVLMDGWTGLIF